MKKTLLIISILLTLLITFTQAYDVRDVEQLSFVIAIGIDKSDSEEEPLKLTIQIAKPEMSDGGGTKMKSETETVNCNSFNIGMSMLNLQNVNELNLSHCTAIIISEEIAREGIENFIDTLSNNVEIRPTCNVLVSKESAEEFLSVASNIEDISSKFYNSFVNSTKVTSYVTPCVLSDFYSALHQDVKSPVALYSFVKDDTIESLGLSVFEDYKMVGRLSGLETICYNILTNNFEEATIEIYNIQNPETPLTVSISHLQDAKIKVDLENNIPKIKCSIDLRAKILSANKQYDYSSEESLREIESEINKFITDNTIQFLYKTSKEYKSDIIGFEGFFKRHYLTQDELDKYNWKELYQKAEFDVEAKTYLHSGFLFSKS